LEEDAAATVAVAIGAADGDVAEAADVAVATARRTCGSL